MTTAGAGALERAKRRIAIGDQYARAHFDDRASEAFRRAARGAPDWHGAAARFPRLKLAGHLASDVYLRADSWRQFVHEQLSGSVAAPLPVMKEPKLLPSP